MAMTGAMLKTMYRRVKPLIVRNALLKKFAFRCGLVLSPALLPKVLTVCLTYRCSCDCAHCGIVRYRKNGEPELSTGEVKALIGDAKKIASIVQVTFTGGDVFFREDLFDLIAYAKKNNFYTKIDANAVMLNEAVLERLRNSSVDRIDFSIDHDDPDHHDALRKSPGLFQKTLWALAECRKLGIPVYLQTYATSGNLNDGTLERIILFCKSKGAARVKIQPPALMGPWEGRHDLALTPQDYSKLKSLLKRHPIAYYESEFFPPDDYPLICKVGLRSNIYVTCYGDVLPCCYVPVSFGSIRGQRLSEILARMSSKAAIGRLSGPHGCLCSDKDFYDREVRRASALPIRNYKI